MTQKELNDLFINIIQNKSSKNFFDYKEDLEQISKSYHKNSDKIFHEFMYIEAGEQSLSNNRMYVSITVDSDNAEKIVGIKKFKSFDDNVEQRETDKSFYNPGASNKENFIFSLELNTVYEFPRECKIKFKENNNFGLVDENGKQIEKSSGGKYSIQPNTKFKVVKSDEITQEAKESSKDNDDKFWTPALAKCNNDENLLLSAFKQIIAQYFVAHLLTKSQEFAKRSRAKDKTPVNFNEVIKDFKSADVEQKYYTRVGAPLDATLKQQVADWFKKAVEATNDPNELVKLLDKNSKIVTKEVFNAGIKLCAGDIKEDLPHVLEYFNRIMENGKVNFDQEIIKTFGGNKPFREGTIDIKAIFDDDDLNKFWSGKFFTEVVNKNANKFDTLIEHLGQPMSAKQEEKLQGALNDKNDIKAKPMLQQKDAETNALRNELAIYCYIGLILGFLDKFGKSTKHEINENKTILSNIAENEYLEGIITSVFSKLFSTSKNLMSRAGRLRMSDGDGNSFLNIAKVMIKQNEALTNQIIKDLDLYNYDDVVLTDITGALDTSNPNNQKLTQKLNKAIEETNMQTAPQIMNQLPKYVRNVSIEPKTFVGKAVKAAGNVLLKGQELANAGKPQAQASKIVGQNVTNINDKNTGEQNV